MAPPAIKLYIEPTCPYHFLLPFLESWNRSLESLYAGGTECNHLSFVLNYGFYHLEEAPDRLHGTVHRLNTLTLQPIYLPDAGRVAQAEIARRCCIYAFKLFFNSFY